MQAPSPMREHRLPAPLTGVTSHHSVVPEASTLLPRHIRYDMLSNHAIWVRRCCHSTTAMSWSNPRSLEPTKQLSHENHESTRPGSLAIGIVYLSTHRIYHPSKDPPVVEFSSHHTRFTVNVRIFGWFCWFVAVGCWFDTFSW